MKLGRAIIKIITFILVIILVGYFIYVGRMILE